jgi:hypothetical protein
MTLIQRPISSIFFILLIASVSVWGDQLARFDDPSIVVALKPNGMIAGYYAGRSNDGYLFGRDGTTAVCQFLFFGKKHPNGYEIKGWETSLIPAPESRVTRGAINIGFTDDVREWVFQFDEVPNGCRSRKDGERLLWHPANYFVERNIPVLYKEEQGVHARVIKRVAAIGVRVVQADTAPVLPHLNAPNGNSKSLFSITLGGLVTAIRQEKEYTYVEYIVPTTGETRSGWIQTKHLKDPFVG